MAFYIILHDGYKDTLPTYKTGTDGPCIGPIEGKIAREGGKWVIYDDENDAQITIPAYNWYVRYDGKYYGSMVISEEPWEEHKEIALQETPWWLKCLYTVYEYVSDNSDSNVIWVLANGKEDADELVRIAGKYEGYSERRNWSLEWDQEVTPALFKDIDIIDPQIKKIWIR